MSVTTRGIGIGTTQMVALLNMYNPTISIPNIYGMYRVFLAIMEAKLELSGRSYNVVIQDISVIHTYNCDAKFLEVCQAVTMVPTPIQWIINAVGMVELEGTKYIPAIAAPHYDQRGRFVPRPENLILSNLRKTVLSLSDDQTPERYRRSFEDVNPIPGCIWVDHTLMNPDEIMPETYGTNQLEADSQLVKSFCNQLQEKVPKLVRGALDFSATGHMSLFVSNEMANLRSAGRRQGESLAQYYTHCLPDGNINTYFMYKDLTPLQYTVGELNLLGEMPEVENYMEPLYTLRRGHIADFRLETDYLTVANALNIFLYDGSSTKD